MKLQLEYCYNFWCFNNILSNLPHYLGFKFSLYLFLYLFWLFLWTTCTRDPCSDMLITASPLSLLASLKNAFLLGSELVHPRLFLCNLSHDVTPLCFQLSAYTYLFALWGPSHYLLIFEDCVGVFICVCYKNSVGKALFVFFLFCSWTFGLKSAFRNPGLTQVSSIIAREY